MTGFNLSAWAVRERAVTVFLIIAIVVAGIVAFFNLGRAEDPSFTVKIMTVGKKGYDILRREFASLIIERVELRDVKQIGFVNADDIARKVIALFNEGQFDVCTLFYSEFKSVISQVPTALQIIPASAPAASTPSASPSPAPAIPSAPSRWPSTSAPSKAPPPSPAWKPSPSPAPCP